MDSVEREGRESDEFESLEREGRLFSLVCIHSEVLQYIDMQETKENNKIRTLDHMDSDRSYNSSIP